MSVNMKPNFNSSIRLFFAFFVLALLLLYLIHGIGQAQRATLAIALAMAPPVLLLDEATSACDPESTLLVEQAVRKSGATVVWVSHDPSQPERVGGRIYSFDYR